MATLTKVPRAVVLRDLLQSTKGSEPKFVAGLTHDSQGPEAGIGMLPLGN